MLFRSGKIFRWAQHWERLGRGAKFLRFGALPGEPELQKAATELIARNAARDAVLRITISRGSGPRGYSARGADTPRVVMTLHPTSADALTVEPPTWRLMTSSIRVAAGDQLAGFKHTSKLANVLARSEAEAADAAEAVLVNTEGFVTECAAANLFWIREGRIETPPLSGELLGGVTRAVVLEVCAALKIPVRDARATVAELRNAEGV